MRLFVTGGTGFIGSHFLDHALIEGHEIVALRRPTSTQRSPDSPRLNWHEGQLDNVPDELLETCDALVHFAAEGVSPQPTDWGRAFQANVQSSLKISVQAEQLGVGHLIACGSCFEYGLSGSRYSKIPVDAPLEPVGPYASSKASFSLAFEALARTSASSFSILRPFHLFGEGQDERNFWPSLRKAAESGEDFAMTSGEQIRDFMPVKEAAKQFLKCLERPPVAGQANLLNLGSGEPISLADFASYWWRQWNAQGELKLGELPYRDSEVMRFIPEL